LALGASALSDSELLGLLIGTGVKGRSAGAIARALIEAAGGLRAVMTKDPHELLAMPGLGPARATQLLAALELGRRAQHQREVRPRLRRPEEIYEYLRPTLSNLRREVFHVLCFNSRNVLLRDARVAEGSQTNCPVDPREVFAVALLTRATAIVLAHNHPAGDPEPSSLDLSLTQQLCAGARVLGLKVLDHIIVGANGFSSLLMRGELREEASAVHS
jgi:DNA repair protein RadC